MFAPTPVTDSFFWFVMRDLKRPNAKQPAYRFLAEQGLEVFTPMTWRLTLRQGKRVREERPFLPDLLLHPSLAGPTGGIGSDASVPLYTRCLL